MINKFMITRSNDMNKTKYVVVYLCLFNTNKHTTTIKFVLNKNQQNKDQALMQTYLLLSMMVVVIGGC